MKVETKKVITISKKEREIFIDFINAFEDGLQLDYEENPMDLALLMEAIYNRDNKVYIDSEETIFIDYED